MGKEFNGHLIEKESQSQLSKRKHACHVFKVVQSKTMRYHCILIRTAKTQDTDDTKCLLVGMWSNQNAPSLMATTESNTTT